MTYKVVVDKPRRVRALASSTKVSVVDAKIQKSSVLVGRATYAAEVKARVLSAFAGYSKPTTTIFYQKPVATGMGLDPYSLNKYFRLEGFGVSDTYSGSVNKGLYNSVTTSDANYLDTQKGLVERARIGDFIYVLLEIQRSFEDGFAFSDTSTVSPRLGKTDSLGAFDVAQFSTSKGLADVAALVEQAALSFSTGFSNSTSVSDLLSRTVDFDRGFSNAVTASDTVGSLVAKPFQDATSVADIFARTVSYDRARTDSVSTVDSESWSMDKGLSDNAPITDLFSRTAAFRRVFDDYVAMDDFTDVGAIQKQTDASKTNVIGFTETQVFATEKGVTDTATLSELLALGTSRAFSESTGVSDAFQKVTVFRRSPDDLVAVGDLASASLAKVLDDAAAATDDFSREVDYQRTVTDAFGAVDQAASTFAKELNESAALADSLTMRVSSLPTSVFNAGALNSAPLNH